MAPALGYTALKPVIGEGMLIDRWKEGLGSTLWYLLRS